VAIALEVYYQLAIPRGLATGLFILGWLQKVATKSLGIDPCT